MKPFMDKDFLLDTECARTLYHEVCENAPILDYHCHIEARDIWNDVKYDNLSGIWLGGDHYKWRLMRAAGIDEKFITGDAAPYDKFLAYVKTVESAVGSPLYHWTHLELQRYFDCHALLKTSNARFVWDACSEKLRAMSARSMILQSNVKLICTTDDPADDLIYHEKLAASDFPVTVLPAFRPDNAVAIDAPGFAAYLSRLGAPKTFADLQSALSARMDFFHAHGCRLSDHGLSYVPFEPATDEFVNIAYQKALAGEPLTETEVRAYQTALLLFLGREYARRDWAMQLHVSVLRNINARMLSRAGANTGFDAIGASLRPEELARFFSKLDETNELPRTIVYSLNPNDDAVLQTISASFNEGPTRGKMQHGSAWWFNDHLDGMRRQIRSLAALGRLSDFVGMLTDSRCFLSYSRHEYFRRILCGVVGDLVEAGLYPFDMELLAPMLRGVCCDNAVSYFRFPEKKI